MQIWGTATIWLFRRDKYDVLYVPVSLHSMRLTNNRSSVQNRRTCADRMYATRIHFIL